MGVSVKETNEPIGFFGTGLKYAIAVCMRLGASIEIDSDGEHITFHAKSENIRNKEFQVIYAYMRNPQRSAGMDEQRMPMTIDYGKTWEPWMALRELHSNTLDENGDMWEEIEDIRMPHRPRDQHGTYITVTCESGSDLETAWIDRHGTWLLNPRRRPVWENDNLQVYMQPSSALYYRGIRVSQKGFESAVTYNILKRKTLTEDRTIDMFDFYYFMADDIIKIETRDLAIRILLASANDKMIESKFHLNNACIEGSDAMREELIRLYRVDPNMISTTARDAATRYIRQHHFDEMYVAVPLTSEQQKRHDQCVTLLDAHGFQLSKYRVRWCKLSDRTLGMADANTNTILLNIMLMDHEKWHEQICITMMEEYIHLEHEVDDATRTFQDKVLALLYDIMMKRPARAGGMLAGLAKIASGGDDISF
jgi:hypothetical protein